MTELQRHASEFVARAPDEVYALVSDITRMGEWSPVCTGGSWKDDGSFVGTNENGELKWETHCRVDVAEPGAEFTFVNTGFAGDLDLVRWSYTFAPAGAGCEVTERWEVLPAYPDFIEGLLGGMSASDYLDGVIEPTQSGMAETLAKVKAAAEA